MLVTMNMYLFTLCVLLSTTCAFPINENKHYLPHSYVYHQMVQVGNSWKESTLLHTRGYMVVPGDPAHVDPNDQLFYWIGATNAQLSLLQPVIAWNYPNYPAQWVGFAMWVWNHNEYCIGEILTLNTGDVVLMDIVTNDSVVDISLIVPGGASELLFDQTTGQPVTSYSCTSTPPVPAEMDIVLASLEHGNHQVDPITLDCSVYPQNPTFHISGWTQRAKDTSTFTSLQAVYYNNNVGLQCQFNATYSTDEEETWNVTIYAGIMCEGQEYDDNCCGGAPLPACSQDSTSCWVNPNTCQDPQDDVCCFIN